MCKRQRTRFQIVVPDQTDNFPKNDITESEYYYGCALLTLVAAYKKQINMGLKILNNSNCNERHKVNCHYILAALVPCL